MTFTVITGMSGQTGQACQGHRLFDQQLTLVFWKGPELTVLTLQCGTYQYYGSNRRHYTGLTSRLAGRYNSHSLIATHRPVWVPWFARVVDAVRNSARLGYNTTGCSIGEHSSNKFQYSTERLGPLPDTNRLCNASLLKFLNDEPGEWISTNVPRTRDQVHKAHGAGTISSRAVWPRS